VSGLLKLILACGFVEGQLEYYLTIGAIAGCWVAAQSGDTVG
jgi:hypothetical protein